MFKLESYITPWLLGYLDQYVKLRPEDLQLSLWGGDAVLYNLDLRLDILQKTMHLPIVFKSGHIHELRLHVPWTKLGSEPVVITINTVECIVKVRDTAYSDVSSTTSSNLTGKAVSTASRARKKLKRQAAEDLPPGYLQSILSRVMNNITFIVNNLILKFVEDDIVLSVNVKSAECYSCDEDWHRAFVDIASQDLVLHKIINFSDLTICLDKSNADGHIQIYQEPVLYRCFMACRLHMTYESINAKLPIQTKLNIMCDKLDIVMSDTQLSMFLRLIELCLALYYGYLDVPTDFCQDADIAQDESSLSLSAERGMESIEQEDEQGWTAWMWSIMPQLLPEEDEEGENWEHHSNNPSKPPILSVGFYINHASLTFKLTEESQEKSSVRGLKLTFHPLMLLEAKGIAVEILLQGLTFFNVQFGVYYISLISLGSCICGHRADSTPENSSILRCGTESSKGNLAYDKGSLFDPLGDQNQRMAARYLLEREEHLNYYSEQYGQQRFGAFWMDYLSTLVLADTPHSGSQSSDTDLGDSVLFHQELSTCRFVFGPSQLQVTSSSVHRIHKLLCCAWTHNYEPYKSNKEQEIVGERVQLAEAQLAELEEVIPTCAFHVTLLKPSILVTPANHPECNVTTKMYSRPIHSHRSKKKPSSAGEGVEVKAVELCVSAERCDMQLLSPMYPARLVKLVSNIAGPSSNLLYHCHSHKQFKIFSLHVELRRPAQRGIIGQPIILLSPTSTAFYFRNLLLPHLWNNSHLPLWEQSYEVPQVSLSISKASVMATLQLIASWTQPQSAGRLHQDSLLTDLFPKPEEDEVSHYTLELSVCGLAVRCCHTPLVQAYTGSLSTLQLLLLTPGHDQQGAGAIPVLYGPVDSSPVQNKNRFQSQPASCLIDGAECMAFTIQKPHHTSITEAPSILVVSIEGVACCLDPALLHWFRYVPRKCIPKLPPANSRTVTVDMPLAQASSPLLTGESHLSMKSGSSTSQPTTPGLFSQSRSPSHTHSYRENSQNDGHQDKQLNSMENFTKLLISTFPLLRMMQVQVNVKSGCLFVPSASLGNYESSVDIAASIQTKWQEGESGEILVLCLPSISIHSVGNNPMDVLQDIPITTLYGSLLSEKLPWTVELSHWNGFTLHPDCVIQPLLSGLSLTSTVGATVHYHPPTSDTIQSLALCLHLDLRPPLISLYHNQIWLLHSFLQTISTIIVSSWQLADHSLRQLSCGDVAFTVGSDPDHAVKQVEQTKKLSQQESSLTVGTPEVCQAVTTDASDDISHHASPLHTILSQESTADNVVKLSAWLQCVLPRFTLSLFPAPGSGEVCVTVEDVALSCDAQQVYCKIKTSVGSISIHNYIHGASGERGKDEYCPVLLTTSQELPQHLKIHSNRIWTSVTQSSAPGFAPQESFNADKMHGFFSLTFTRALCRNVRRKMKKLNVELTGTSETEDIQSTQGFFFNQFVSEVCLKIDPVDVVLHLPTLKRVLSLWQMEGQNFEQADLNTICTERTQQRVTSFTLPSSHRIPLFYMDVSALRTFFLLEDSCEQPEEVTASSSTLLHNFLLLQWSSLHVQPYADNPLPRYPVDQELFNQALQSGMMQQTGSCIEDRQFQLQVRRLAMASGVWADVMHRPTQKKDSHFEKVTTGVQNPALEWNYLGFRPAVEEKLLIPIVSAFDLCLLLAPPIAYSGGDRDQDVYVCGLAAELNAVSDLNLYLSAQQLCLLIALTDNILTLRCSSQDQIRQQDGTAATALVSQDSGVASELSAFTHHDPAAVWTPVPANILLTAGRISLTVYSHLYLQSNRVVKTTHPADFHTTQANRRHRQHSVFSATSADNFPPLPRDMSTFSKTDSSLEDSLSFNMLKLGSGDLDVKLEGGCVCVQPFVYIYFAQPHAVLRTWPKDDRLELSCYDVLVKGVQLHNIFPVTDQRVMPEHADFNLYWVETRSGQPDSKTGIPPCLLTMQIASILAAQVSVEVKLERPVRISLSNDTLSQVTDFLHHVTPALNCGKTDVAHGVSGMNLQPDSADGSDKKVQFTFLSGAISVVNHLRLQTEQVVLLLEGQDSTEASGLLVSVESIRIATEEIEKKGEQLEVQGSMYWKDMLLKTIRNKTQRPLAGPVTVESSILLRWPGKRQTTPPQVVMGVQTSLLLLYVGQEHVLCLQHLVSLLQPLLYFSSPLVKDSSPQQWETGKATDESGPKGAAMRKPMGKDTAQLTVLNSSHDDLRSGQFVFVHNETDGCVEWPAVHQAVFSAGEEDSDVDSTLTWAYTEPRLITALTTLPVPIGQHTAHILDPSPMVSCRLQYWDECAEMFVTYASFELCEESSSSIHLPQVQLTNIRNLVVAYVWRVSLYRPTFSSQWSAHSSSTYATNTRKGMLLATQLAGSMRVDSVLVPSLVPILQLSLTMPNVQVHLHNHMFCNIEAKKMKGSLADYTLSSLRPLDQQWGVLTLSKICLQSSHTTGPHCHTTVQIQCQSKFEVVDYNSLTLLPVLDPTDVNASFRVEHHQEPSAVEGDISTSLLHFRLGRSALHTINSSILSWTEYGKKEEGRVTLFAHLILCNNTQQTIRFGQAGTDENIALNSGHMLPYSWRTSAAKQQLHLCLDQPTWRWCTPLDICEGHRVRIVRAKDQRYTLIIQITSLSSIHKQVIVSGQFVVCSRLSQAVEVRFQLQDGGKDGAEYVSVVKSDKPVPTFVVEHEEMASVSIRLAGHNLPWSHSLSLSGQAMHRHQLLKMLLPDGVSFIHVWCRIFCQNFNETVQKLIFLSPLYVLRSHLPLTLHANLLTPRTKQHQTLKVGGQGQEYQLHCTGGDIIHHLSFKLGPELAESSPPVVLSTGLVEQVEQTNMTDISIQSLCQEHRPSLAMYWPYSSVQSSRVDEEKRWSEIEQAGVNVNVQLSQYLPGCNTLLVDIYPWCLLTNLTPLPLLLLNNSRHLFLPEGCTIAPPAMQELQIGYACEGQVWESPPIPLSEDEVEQHRYSVDVGKVLYLDGQVQQHLLLPPEVTGGLMQVIPLSVTSAVQHEMRIVAISERLRLSNVSGLTLQAQLLAVPQSSVKVQQARFAVETTCFAVHEKRQSKSAHALLKWQLLQDGHQSFSPMDLVFYMSFRIQDDSRPSQWSVPVHIESSPEDWQSTVTVSSNGRKSNCLSLCIKGTVQGALTYVVVSQDNNPMCWIHNLCPFPLRYGQALDKATFKGITVQEETELLEAVPVVASGGHNHYTMPYVNKRFPQVDSGSFPRLHVQAILQQSSKSAQEQLSDWSAGIALDAGDTFLHMTGVASIKVNIQFLSMVYHITFNVLNKAEVSAKEVRSRIHGGHVTRLEETAVSHFIPSSTFTASEWQSESAKSEAEGSVTVNKTWPPVTLGLLLEGIVMTLCDDVSQVSIISSLLQLELQQVLLACYPIGGASCSMCVALCVGNIRMDNPLAYQGFYDFPVILQPQQIPPQVQPHLTSQLDLTEVLAVLRADSFFHVQFMISRDPLLSAGWFLDSVEMSIKPLSIYFEDTYVFRLYEECLCLVPQNLGSFCSGESMHSVPANVWDNAWLHQQPIRIQHLCIQPISLLLSVHASLRLFLATDHAPLTLGRFERHRLFTCTQQLAYTMAVHYITAAIFRAGMVVGSLDLLGSPTGLVRSVSTGLSDLLRLPYQGLTHSFPAFVSGIIGGVTSLIRNVAAGMMISVTNFASSVSRNMDRLSLDSGHQQRQEETRRRRPSGLTSGLQQGLTGFGLSLLGAVAGLVDQPLQSVLTQESSSTSSTAGKIITGVGRGLVGIITKPIGGAAELLSQTGQGILQGSGLKRVSGPRHSITDIQRCHLPTAWLKYSEKLLAETDLLLAVSASQQDLLDEATDVVLLLTVDMVVVVNQEEDGQQQAFSLLQLLCHAPAPAILTLTVADTSSHNPAQMCSPNSEDRVAAFINSTANLSGCADGTPWTLTNDVQGQLSEAGTKTFSFLDTGISKATASLSRPGATSLVNNDQTDLNFAAAPFYQFRLDPYWCQIFVALFHLARNRQMGKGFTT